MELERLKEQPQIALYSIVTVLGKPDAKSVKKKQIFHNTLIIKQIKS
jgi:hypothetical protein